MYVEKVNNYQRARMDAEVNKRYKKDGAWLQGQAQKVQVPLPAQGCCKRLAGLL